MCNFVGYLSVFVTVCSTFKNTVWSTCKLDGARVSWSGKKRGVWVKTHLFIARLEVGMLIVDVSPPKWIFITLIWYYFSWHQALAEVSSYKICHLYLAASPSPVSCAIGHGWRWCSALLVLWPFSRADLTVSEADLLRSPVLPACLILHATGISSIDHGCRSVCRCLHRSVSLITHSHSSARLLISPRPLSLCLPLVPPSLVPLCARSLSVSLSHTFF